MAIINNDNGEYVKIDFDNTYVNGKGTHCVVYVYKDKNERDKDKSRAENINTFLNNVTHDYNIICEILLLKNNIKMYETNKKSQAQDPNYEKNKVDEFGKLVYEDYDSAIIDTTKDIQNLKNQLISKNISDSFTNSEWNGLKNCLLGVINEASFDRKKEVVRDINPNIVDNNSINMFTELSGELYAPTIFKNNLYEQFKDYFLDIGYNPEWMESPVLIIKANTLYCSQEKSDLNETDLYNKLKRNYYSSIDQSIYIEGEDSTEYFGDDL